MRNASRNDTLETFQELARDLSRSMDTLTSANSALSEADIRRWLQKHKSAPLLSTVRSEKKVSLTVGDTKVSLDPGTPPSEIRKWLAQSQASPWNSSTWSTWSAIPTARSRGVWSAQATQRFPSA
jgi:hypothetical protein